jgi:heme/copper-type cytochrome/quinol oxidase subunit 3
MKHEKEQKTRKRHPDIFYDFVLSEISCFRVFFLAFVKLKASTQDEGFSPIPRTGK